MSAYTEQLSDLEKHQRTQYKNHPIICNFHSRSDDDVISVLIERRHISCVYTDLLRKARSRISCREGEEMIDYILDEESTPEPHTILNTRDLRRILTKHGIKEVDDYLDTRPSRPTQQTIHRLYELFDTSGQRPIYYAALVHFGGEVLPGLEFEIICRELYKRELLDPKESEFFEPHRIHDRVEQETQSSENGEPTHIDVTNIAIQSLLQTTEDLSSAKKAVRSVCQAREEFYNQFLD